jgi:hypothetical protein
VNPSGSNSVENATGPGDVLIDRLVDDLHPVRPASLALVYALTFSAQVVVVAGAAFWKGLGVEELLRIYQGPMPILMAVLGVGGVLAALGAARLSLPGRHVSAGRTAATLAIPAVLALGVVLLRPWGGDWRGAVAHWSEGLGCTVDIVSIAIPAWLLTVALLVRLAPLSPWRTGLLAGASALLQGALVMQLVCPVGDCFHLAISHYLPVAVLAVATGVLAGWVLRRVGSSALS